MGGYRDSGKRMCHYRLPYLAMEANIVMAASWWGKVKTTTQMIMIPVLLLNLPFACMPVLEKLLVILAVFFTIFSGADYIIKNKQVLMG